MKFVDEKVATSLGYTLGIGLARSCREYALFENVKRRRQGDNNYFYRSFEDALVNGFEEDVNQEEFEVDLTRSSTRLGPLQCAR